MVAKIRFLPIAGADTGDRLAIRDTYQAAEAVFDPKRMLDARDPADP